MNKVLLTGRLTRDPEMRSLASGKNVTTFTVASNEFLGGGKEKAEYHPIVAWDRLAEIAAVAAAVGISSLIAIDGETNWLEGALLTLVYAILAISFFEFV